MQPETAGWPEELKLEISREFKLDHVFWNRSWNKLAYLISKLKSRGDLSRLKEEEELLCWRRNHVCFQRNYLAQFSWQKNAVLNNPMMKSWRQTPCRIMSLLGTSQENSLYCVYGTKIPSRGFLDHPCHCEVTPSGMSCLRDLKISINEPLFKNLAANARVDSSDFRESTQWKADRALLVVFGIPGIPVEQVASQIDSSFVAETKSPIFCADYFHQFFLPWPSWPSDLPKRLTDQVSQKMSS